MANRIDGHVSLRKTKRRELSSRFLASVSSGTDHQSSSRSSPEMLAHGDKGLNFASHGTLSLIGRRRSMEDAVTIAMVGTYDLFVVSRGYEGCSGRLNNLLAQEVVAYGGKEVDWKRVMSACFMKIDEESGLKACEAVEMERMVARRSTAGSAAVVVVVTKEEIVVANRGDSRAILCRRDSVIPLSRNHKPERTHSIDTVDTIRERILNCDAFRTSASRPISNCSLRPPYEVSKQPEVTVTKRTESDHFLVIGSNGLWNAVSDEVACLVVTRCLEGRTNQRRDRADEATALLANLAIAQGSKDNISIVVVELKAPTGSDRT